MAQFVVRRIEEAVKARLQHRARRNGWSLEQEVRNILRMAVTADEITGDAPELHSETFPAEGMQPRKYRVRPKPLAEDDTSAMLSAVEKSQSPETPSLE